jgi:hypothetical protein
MNGDGELFPFITRRKLHLLSYSKDKLSESGKYRPRGGEEQREGTRCPADWRRVYGRFFSPKLVHFA